MEEDKAAAPANETPSQPPVETKALVNSEEAKPERADWKKCAKSDDGMPKCTNILKSGKRCPRNGLHAVGGKLYCFKHKAPALNRLKKAEEIKSKLKTAEEPMSAEDDKKGQEEEQKEETKHVRFEDEQDSKPSKKRKSYDEELPTPPEAQALNNYDDQKVELVESSDEEDRKRKKYKAKKKAFVKKKMEQYKRKMALEERTRMPPEDPTHRRTTDVFNNATAMSKAYYAPKPPVTINPESRLF